MKTIGVITNTDKDCDLEITKMLQASIERSGGKVLFASEISQAMGNEYQAAEDESLLDGSDIVICLGGDGTFLNAARKIYKKGIPILGINLGRLGFLTEVDVKGIDQAVENIINGDYVVEQRMMLEAVVTRDGEMVSTGTALNDVIISRGAISRILHAKTYINDVYVDTFPGDGLIIASPTGSTAYSLSAGGPIVEPDIDLIIVTPICPHILYSRSFITTGDRAVKVVIDENSQHIATVSIDGQKAVEVRGGDVIEVRRSTSYVKMVRMNPRNFFDILRSKIYYRGESF